MGSDSPHTRGGFTDVCVWCGETYNLHRKYRRWFCIGVIPMRGPGNLSEYLPWTQAETGHG